MVGITGLTGFSSKVSEPELGQSQQQEKGYTITDLDER